MLQTLTKEPKEKFMETFCDSLYSIYGGENEDAFGELVFYLWYLFCTSEGKKIENTLQKSVLKELQKEYCWKKIKDLHMEFVTSDRLFVIVLNSDKAKYDHRDYWMAVIYGCRELRKKFYSMFIYTHNSYLKEAKRNHCNDEILRPSISTFDKMVNEPVSDILDLVYIDETIPEAIQKEIELCKPLNEVGSLLGKKKILVVCLSKEENS